MVAVLLDDRPLDSHHYRKLITWVCCLFLSKQLPGSQDRHPIFFFFGGGGGSGCITVEQKILYNVFVCCKLLGGGTGNKAFKSDPFSTKSDQSDTLSSGIQQDSAYISITQNISKRH